LWYDAIPKIYASKGEKESLDYCRSSEWPYNMGVILGANWRRGMFDGITDAASMDSEMGLPILLHRLPVGLMGLMLSSYFSAILSTADSCLMAASKHRN
jgi:SSS family solute:Na+ symporter